jgi:hypothetical protein
MNIVRLLAQVTNGDPNNCPPTALTCLNVVKADDGAVKTILSFTFAIIAAIAVLVIVIAGIQFTLSQGNPEKAANARKSIIYAGVGLAVSLSAEFLVLFLLGRV